MKTAKFIVLEKSPLYGIVCGKNWVAVLSSSELVAYANVVINEFCKCFVQMKSCLEQNCPFCCLFRSKYSDCISKQLWQNHPLWQLKRNPWKLQLKSKCLSTQSLAVCYSHTYHSHWLFTVLIPSQVLKLGSKYHSTLKLSWMLL